MNAPGDPIGLAEALHLLASEAGIHESYWDIVGNLHVTPPETKRAILAAMGIPADTDAAALQSLKLWRERPWRALLPPVTVLRRQMGGKPFAVPLTIPDVRAAEPLTWRLMLETGTEIAGETTADALAATAHGEINGIRLSKRELPLPPFLPEGYHTLVVGFGGRESQSPLIVAPAAAYIPDWMVKGERRWGLAVQVYSLRRDRDWGIGDFTALGELAHTAKGLGAEMVGINPLHALFPVWPDACSPYSPSSPEFINPLMIDIAAIPFAAASPGLAALCADPKVAAALAAARDCELIDYPAISDLKYRALWALYQDYLEQPDVDLEAFEAFCIAGGDRLRRFAEFSALHESMGGLPWATWPAPYRDPASQEVAAYAIANAERVTFHAFLQWLADAQLAQAATAAPGVGLYRDLAVGVNADGADAWSNQGDIVSGISVGAPPDAFSPVGQDWGLPPPNPHRMRETAYAGFIALLRANMRHAKALRLDHVMGLMRLFWIPAGLGVPNGAYVSYPFDDLLAIVALESCRNRCLVIGEDLGTVPDDFRGRLATERLLSYRVLYFERWESGLFRRPDAYPPLALVTPTTHDMPTPAGNWLRLDLQLRTDIGIYADADTVARENHGRARETEALLAALADQNLSPEPPPADTPDALAALTHAVLRYAARTPSRLLMVNVGDLLVEKTQINLPGTVNEHPNWRRRMPQTVTDLANDPLIRAGVAAIARER